VIRQLTIAVALSVLVACGSLFLYVHVLNERSLAILRTAYELSGKKQTPNVADIQEHFGNRLRLDECRASECTYRVVVSNQILAALRIVPYTEMQSHFWTRDGVVLTNMVDYTTTVNRHYRIVSHVQIDFCKDCQAFAIHPWGAASPLDTNGVVEIGNKALAESRRTVLSLNTGCLTKFGGCQSVADLLPTVWKQTGDKKIACVIQNDRGFVQKPANWQ
jgi:hypothetical protein